MTVLDPPADGVAARAGGGARRAALAGGGWALMGQALALTLGLARTLVVARFLGAGELGVLGVALFAMGALEALTALGLDTALVQARGDVRADLDSAFTLQALRGALLAAALWAAAPWVGAFFAAPGAVPALRVLCVAPLFRGLASPATVLRVRALDFRRLFWWSVPESVAAFALGVGLAWARPEAWVLAGSVAGAAAVGTAASYGAAPWRPRLVLRAESARRLLGFGRWVHGTRVLMFFSRQTDIALVGRLLGTAALGFYQLAFRLAEAPVVALTQVAARVSLPALSALRAEPERLRREYLRAFRWVAGANLAFAAGAVVLAGPVVRALLGPGWGPAVPALRILAVAMVFRSVVLLGGELFHALGEPRVTTRMHAVRLAVVLALIYPLLRAYGLEGVAVAVLAAGAAATVVYLRAVRRLLGVRWTDHLWGRGGGGAGG